jgi:hypothetical protein
MKDFDLRMVPCVGPEPFPFIFPPLPFPWQLSAYKRLQTDKVL